MPAGEVKPERIGEILCRHAVRCGSVPGDHNELLHLTVLNILEMLAPDMVVSIRYMHRTVDGFQAGCVLDATDELHRLLLRNHRRAVQEPHQLADIGVLLNTVLVTVL